MAEGDEVIDPRSFIKQLAPDQLGMFEPLSGLMLLNLSRAELGELQKRYVARTPTDFDLAMIHTINHEAYHFAQVVSSGYVFHREARLLMVMNAVEPVPEVPIEPEMQAMMDAAREEAEGDPELMFRYERMVAMLKGHNEFVLYDQLAAKGDHSMVGALMPGFFAHMTALADSERVDSADGLSILGVIEGSAVVHAHMLMHGDEDATPYIEAELKTLPPVYSQLYEFTVAHAGGRALELLLPASALALRFMQPHTAYPVLLSLLAQSAPGEAVAYGRSLIERLPEVTEGGHLLGTAIELRRMHDGYRVYDSVLSKLENGDWGIDSYDFLAQPKAMFSVGTFPLGIVTTDSYLGPLEPAELAARMVLMGAVLRSRGRRKAQREFEEFQADWARSVINRMFGDGPVNEG
jgi:hypothetical protein